MRSVRAEVVLSLQLLELFEPVSEGQDTDGILE